MASEFNQDYPPGLPNLGNTCFLNSVLQSLFAVKDLSNNLLTSQNHTNGKILGQYRNMLKAHNIQDIDLLEQRLAHFYQAVMMANEDFGGFSQQDAHEFLRWLLHQMNEDISPNMENGRPSTPNLNETSKNMISEIFEGIFLSQLLCTNCQKLSSVEEHFYDISASITDMKVNIFNQRKIQEDMIQLREKNNRERRGDNSSVSIGKALASDFPHLLSVSDTQGLLDVVLESTGFSYGKQAFLSNCLNGFFSTEMLAGDECFHCDNCQKRCTFLKTLTVKKPPKVLCVHLKRFKYEGFSKKIKNKVGFPLVNLEMGQYCQPIQSSTTEQTKLISNARYDLFAAICHIGEVGVGHYITYVKSENGCDWLEFNDSKCRKVNESTVRQSEAYVLLYRLHTTDPIYRSPSSPLPQHLISPLNELNKIKKKKESRGWTVSKLILATFLLASSGFVMLRMERSRHVKNLLKVLKSYYAIGAIQYFPDV